MGEYERGYNDALREIEPKVRIMIEYMIGREDRDRTVLADHEFELFIWREFHKIFDSGKKEAREGE